MSDSHDNYIYDEKIPSPAQIRQAIRKLKESNTNYTIKEKYDDDIPVPSCSINKQE